MPLPASMDATWLNGSVSFNAQELRRADSAGFSGDGSAFGVSGGIVRHGDTSLAVTVSSTDVVTIQPGAVVVPGNSGVGNGCYCAALGAAETGNLSARSATLPRIDLVVFRILDTDVVASHAAYTGRIEILAGAPAASPVAPALPVLAVELARITVPISGGAAATVDSSLRQFANSLGGTLAVGSAARLPASAAKYQKAIAVDTGVEYLWTGTAWVTPRIPGEVIAATIINPTTGGNVQSTVAGTITDLPPYTVTFVVPPSGRVKVRATGLVSAIGGRAYWLIREGATELARMWLDCLTSGSTPYHDVHKEVSFVITGLTPGATKTYKLSQMAENTPTGNNMYTSWGGGTAPGMVGLSLFEVSAYI